jgi:peptidoglycan/LPS O-acetylase OafA/YrhL
VEDKQAEYFPALDGLRALAVGAVLLFHAGHLRGGFLGVDTFFVISGFLITGLLLREVERDGTVGLGAFWARRARRLLPALALMVSAITLWSLRYGTPSERLSLHGDSLWSLSFLMNWHEVAAAHDYWSSFAMQSPLTHLWSLAVEEQFYLVWPLVALAVVRWARRPQRTMFVVCAVGAAISFVLMAMLYHPSSSTRVYEGTDTRIGALLIGGLCATSVVRAAVARSLAHTNRRVNLATAAVVIACAGGAFAMYGWAHGNDPLLFRGGFLIFAIAIGVVICAISSTATSHRSRAVANVAAVLSLRPLRAIGRLSYGLYLWHWPIFVVFSPTRTGLSTWPLLAVRLAVTWVVAVVSYRVVEQPIRVSLQRRPQWISAPATAAGIGVAALLAVTVALPGAGATAVNVEGIAALAGSAGSAATSVRGLHITTTTAHQTASVPQPAQVASDAAVPPIAAATTTTQPIIKRGTLDTVVYFGDSIAYTTEPGVFAAFDAAGVKVMSAAGPGVGLVKFSNYFDFLNTNKTVLNAHPWLALVQLSVWDAPYGEQTNYASLTLLHQYIVDRHGQMAIMTPPPLRADQVRPGIDTLSAAAQHVAADSPQTVILLDSSTVWGPTFSADLNGDHVPERMYDGVHICPSGAALVGAWMVSALAPYFDDLTPAPVTSWAGGDWTHNPIYSSPPGTCAAV